MDSGSGSGAQDTSSSSGPSIWPQEDRLGKLDHGLDTDYGVGRCRERFSWLERKGVHMGKGRCSDPGSGSSEAGDSGLRSWRGSRALGNGVGGLGSWGLGAGGQSRGLPKGSVRLLPPGAG